MGRAVTPSKYRRTKLAIFATGEPEEALIKAASKVAHMKKSNFVRQAVIEAAVKALGDSNALVSSVAAFQQRAPKPPTPTFKN